MTELYDMVIVGGGPAGLAAAIYGARAKMKTVIIEEGELGGQAASTQVIENYPGFFGPEAGQDVVEKMAAHAAHFGAEIISDEVTGVELVGEMKKVTTVEHGVYQGHTVIFCPGSQPRVLGIPGELEFRGRGVSYCATCDGDFFTDLELAVVGNGDAAIEEAMHLTRFASKVTIIVIHDQGIVDCNKVSAEKAFANPKISWVWNSVLTEIQGEELVDGVTIKNIKTGECSALAVSGVFFFVGSVPRTQLVAQQLPLNPQGYIIT
ncbi:MAG: FAD-dependent oxidoreductase, partial [Clostridiales bacterium]